MCGSVLGVADDRDTLLLAGLVDQFFAARRSRKDSPNTIKAYRNHLTMVCGHLAAIHGARVELLTAGHLTLPAVREAFGRYADTHAKTSTSLCWSAWNQFFDFLVAEGVREGSPMAAIPKPRVPRRSPKPLIGDDTIEILLSTAGRKAERAIAPWPERDVAILATLLLTGLRSSELLSLTIGSITGIPGERRVTVVGKGEKSRTVPIERPLYDVIERYLASRRLRFPAVRLGSHSALFIGWQGKPMGRGGLQYLVASTLKRAGLEGRRSPGAMVHALRHTFATKLAENGAGATEIMHLLGHASLTTSQGYIDSTGGEQRTAAAANPIYRDLAASLDTEYLPHLGPKVSAADSTNG